MRVMVSGGGTGGHIYPAITIIERLRAQDPSVEILYVGTKKLVKRKEFEQFVAKSLEI